MRNIIPAAACCFAFTASAQDVPELEHTLSAYEAEILLEGMAYRTAYLSACFADSLVDEETVTVSRIELVERAAFVATQFDDEAEAIGFAVNGNDEALLDYQNDRATLVRVKCESFRTSLRR